AIGLTENALVSVGWAGTPQPLKAMLSYSRNAPMLLLLAPVAVSLKVVEPVVLVSPVKSTVCCVNDEGRGVIAGRLVKPEPLLYATTRLVGPGPFAEAM